MSRPLSASLSHRIRQSRRGLSLLGRLRALMALRAQRRALAQLDDHLLADIGLTPDAARIESERPLWDVPAHWHSHRETR